MLSRFFGKRMAQLVAVTAIGLAAATVSAASLDYSTHFDSGIGSEWSIATTYNNGDSGILGRLADGSATLSLVSSGVGSGRLTFDLLGFNTVDGENCCTDTFRLLVNGAEILKGYFNLGGGGSEYLVASPPNTVVTITGSQIRTIGVDVAIASGTNTIRFDYGAMQGFGDESWGMDNVALSASVAAVPEPETYALMLAGLGLVGVAACRRKRA